MCLGCDYYVTIECAQTICAPLLQNAQYATEVRRFSAHTRNRCVMKITKYPDVLALQYCPLFNTHFAIDFSECAILYGWWLLEEGTSRNVPIAGFEMILREDYKSRDEVEGLIFFPKYHFKPQDTGNIPWCSRQQSRHLLYCMTTHCLARLRHSSQKFTKLSICFQRGFPLSCAQCNAYPLYCAPQCNAYPLYCARNKKPVRG